MVSTHTCTFGKAKLTWVNDLYCVIFCVSLFCLNSKDGPGPVWEYLRPVHGAVTYPVWQMLHWSYTVWHVHFENLLAIYWTVILIEIYHTTVEVLFGFLCECDKSCCQNISRVDYLIFNYLPFIIFLLTELVFN